MKLWKAAVAGGTAVGAFALALVAVRRKTTPTTGTTKPGGTDYQIVPPPPGAVWLQDEPPTSLEGGGAAGGAPSGGAGGAPSGGVPSGGAPAGGASPAAPAGGAPGWQLTSATGAVVSLDAVAFLDERFAPAENKPTTTQLARLKAAFTSLGVLQDGKIYTRPSYDAMNAALDLATQFDLERAPAAVGAAVRDFSRAAYEYLPAPVERKA